MPQFGPGESKKARIVMRNPTGTAFDYDALIYLGTDLVVVSQQQFHLEPGQEKPVDFPMVMPASLGTYPVHIGVFSGGTHLALYRATEDVVILPAYEVDGAFRREMVCEESYVPPGADYNVCTRYSANERNGILTVTNTDSADTLTIFCEGWLAWSQNWEEFQEGQLHSRLVNRQWVDYFARGQTKTYVFYYIVPSTGMPLNTKWFVKVVTPSGAVILDKVFVTSR
jgi:hypothetical protein